ncbi:helix-turn-helix transcriptional regulator [Corynebacterium pilbarense]
MANDNDMVVRQVGLTFALLASPAKRDVAWVQANVDGYGGRTRDAATHLIERDVRELRDLGVPARYQDGEVWVVKDLYELPAVDLTAEEASVVGLAADLSKPGSLGEFARSGWTKLAASGATRSMDAPALMSVSNDIFQLRPDTLRAIVKCVQAKQRISFDFVRAPGKAPERRVVDPWGVVSLNNRAYFVGYDIEREDVRVFRLKKVSGLKKVRHIDAFHERAGDLQALVEEALRGELIDATVTVTHGTGEELAQRGTRASGVDTDGQDHDTITLRDVDRDWAVRTIASLAGSVVAVEPVQVRQDVVKLLRTAVEGSD